MTSPTSDYDRLSDKRGVPFWKLVHQLNWDLPINLYQPSHSDLELARQQGGKLLALLDLVYLRAQTEDRVASLLAHARARGDESVIHRRVLKGVKAPLTQEPSRRYVNQDLLNLVVLGGDEAQINEAATQFVGEYQQTSPLDFESKFNVEGSILRQTLERIRASVQAYCVDTPFLSRKASPYLVDANAAVEFFKSNYDLTVGIAQGGIKLPILMEMLGQPTAYIRSSQRTRRAHWFGLNTLPAHAGRILVCEDDSVTGRTLDKVLPLLDRLSPEQVDICYTGATLLPGSKEIARVKARFTQVLDTFSVSFGDFMSNMRRMEEAANNPRTKV